MATACVPMCQPSASSAIEFHKVAATISPIIITTVMATTHQVRRSALRACAPAKSWRCCQGLRSCVWFELMTRLFRRRLAVVLREVIGQRLDVLLRDRGAEGIDHFVDRCCPAGLVQKARVHLDV